ncbi:uncharacterized protein THITE_2106481 [Thermothielavioides terrestris NRRL 8126]|uniref:Uncharacterized protein n=1 Tax=Thermothielavioides terrestris (strain ATCC 38088 / NRRL 8126) TaxID=578455 RepID=G2QXR1_THETT|nr:uncharacterized protein THITE_2106481 [Thermothielavioides terrestris NRRL 8126]AEO62379.1 hypothetical protein THITE_2106481 [Thermothielavioides terrestris NRRL 8126]
MVNSLVWTAEEAKYLKAIFQWRDAVSSSDDEERQHQQEEDGKRQHQDQHQQQRPAGQFRILVVGGRGTGKTAILTRFAQNTFRGEGQPPDPSFERGCRHPVTVDVPPVTTTSCSSPPPSSTSTTTNNIAKPQSQPAAQAQKVSYIIDAVEMPSQQLLSNPQLALALSITEAAVLVYSVRDAASLQLAIGLAEFMREYFAPPAPFSSPTPSSLFCARGLLGMGSRAGAGTAGPSSAGAGNGDRGRPYPVVLVGSKCDAPACGPDADPVAILQEERAVSWAEARAPRRRCACPASAATCASWRCRPRPGKASTGSSARSRRRSSRCRGRQGSGGSWRSGRG